MGSSGIVPGGEVGKVGMGRYGTGMGMVWGEGTGNGEGKGTVWGMGMVWGEGRGGEGRGKGFRVRCEMM